ncbi:MAG: carboxypeptidase regulatory-like domain-containing protein [Woeseiaceae bacterium]|nr:carboxypeptidase regulatory-like domain-containing protein [Woeseiaceae bacterium]
MSRRILHTAFLAPLVAAALTFAATGVAAQDNDGGLIVETRATETGRPLAGVEITITDRGGKSREDTTGADGSVSFASLAPGLYDVTAAAAGRVTVEEPSVRVSRRKTTPLALELVEVDGPVDEIVVVARGRVADQFGAASNSFFNREELRSAVGAGSDVMRALDGLPGLVSTGDFANFSVRGRGPRDNLIFVDELPFGRVVHFDQTLGEEEDIGGGGRFSIFAPNSITGAEFSPGGWSAAYGGRSGSLLKLEVAGGNPTPSASLRVDIAGVELGYEGPSGIHDGTTAFFSARSFDFGRVFEFIDEEDIGQPELTDIVLKTVTELDDRNTIEFLGIYAPEEYTRDIDNVLASPNFEDVALIETEQDLALVGLSWRRLVGSAGEWTNRVYFRDNDKTSSEGEAFPDLVPEGTPAEDIPVRENLLTVGEAETEIGWRSDFSTRNRLGEFQSGLRVWQTDVDYFVFLREDWDRFVYRSTDPRPPGQQYITLQPAEVSSEFSERETSYAAYGEQVFEFGDWDIRAGLRFEQDGFADESLLAPRLAANWRPSAGRRLSATAGVFYQSPRFLVRSANPDNFDIENERITHFSIGLEQQFGQNWTLLVEPYYQQLDNLIVAEGRTSGRASNAGDGRNFGVDVVLSRRFSNGWFGNIVYAYNDARIDDNDGLGEYDADFNRPHFFSAGGSWEINERWKVGARWKWASGRPTDDFIINEDVLGPGQPLRYSKELTRTNTQRLENYHSLNVRVDYRRELGWVDLIAFIDVINAYGGPGANSQEFDPRNGINVVEDNEAFPIFGLIFERAW